MKKKCFFAVLATAVLALVGCQKQSELKFEDIAGKAVVQGYVYIDKGYIQDSKGNFACLNEPANGVAVEVRVDYQKYDADAAAGKKKFEGVCDANGFYRIEIPVGQAAITGMSAYTKDFTGEYYDLVNGAIQKVSVSYPEVSVPVQIENGKIYTAANMIVSKDVEKPILSRNQVVTVRGQISEFFEKKTYIDPEDKDKGYTVSKDSRNATVPVSMMITFTNTDPKFNGQSLVFNVVTNAEGAYSLEVNLYDTWDLSKTELELETKSYLNTMVHYYKKYDADEKSWSDKSQDVNGYYKKGSISKTLSDGDLLVGCTLPKVALTFVPDYANMIIYGIGNNDIDIVSGVTTYTSTNPLAWAY